MNVAYCGPLKDYSGYGEANRHAAAALDAAGATVIGESMHYVSESSDFGELGELMDKLIARVEDYKIKIIHTTPDEYKRFIEPGRYHIGHFFWETDRVPDDYIEGCKLVDEIWTGSLANERALRNGGYTGKIFVCPQAIQTTRPTLEPYENQELENKFVFYSIFEWTDRKNPGELVRSFTEAFDGDDNVALVIKTYFRNFTLQNKRMIRNQVEVMRGQKTNTPPVYLYLDLMDRTQIERLHTTGDCYVSAHRGEGWGVPQVEAAIYGNPVISTGYGGCHEYFESPKEMWKLKYSMVPVRGMDHYSRLYSRPQNWAEVDHADLVKAMQWAYNNQAGSAKMGAAGRKAAIKQFNLASVGKLMADRLADIEVSLG